MQFTCFSHRYHSLREAVSMQNKMYLVPRENLLILRNPLPASNKLHQRGSRHLMK